VGPEKERADAVRTAIDEYLRGQYEIADQRVTRESSLSLDRSWEISRTAAHAAEQLLVAVEAMGGEELTPSPLG
jgi:hypothetical protein